VIAVAEEYCAPAGAAEASLWPTQTVCLVGARGADPPLGAAACRTGRTPIRTALGGVCEPQHSTQATAR
jgi:hypothetical protein